MHLTDTNTHILFDTKKAFNRHKHTHFTETNKYTYFIRHKKTHLTDPKHRFNRHKQLR